MNAIKLLGFCLVLSLNIQAQNCFNLSFEQANFNGWISSSGTVSQDGTKTIFSPELIGQTANMHRLMSVSDGYDPNIYQDRVVVVPAGATYAARLGISRVTNNRGGRYSRIKNTFVVDKDLSLLQYKFAIVLEDDINRSQGEHKTYEKPGFNVKILDKNGNKIACSFYDVQIEIAKDNIDGFKVQNQFFYRDWTTVAVNLEDHIGETLTLEVTAWGCTGRGHFGYAYFTAKCLNLDNELSQRNACPDADGLITLDAPEGFEKYTWENGKTDRSIRVKPNEGEKYTVKMLPFNSLNEKCELKMSLKTKNPEYVETINKQICEGEEFDFRGKKFKKQGSFVETYESNTCKETFTINLTVEKLKRFTRNIDLCEGKSEMFLNENFSRTGVYERQIKEAGKCDSYFYVHVNVTPLDRINNVVSICKGDTVRVGRSKYTITGQYVDTLKQENACDRIVKTDLKVENDFELKTSANQIVEENEMVTIEAKIDPLAGYVFEWSEGIPCKTCLSNTISLTQSKAFVITAKAPGGKCITSDTSYVTVACGLVLPKAFTPNGDGLNDRFSILDAKCVRTVNAFRIYNRWGELCYEALNFNPFDPDFYWDGFYNHQPGLAGNYLYKILYTKKDGSTLIDQGSIALLR